MKKEETKIVIKNSMKDLLHPVLAKRTFAQKAADRLTAFVGSWTFIILSAITVILWISANIYGWVQQWDPFPFILLNLVLSILAAMQAPIILMSQNRQSERDRVRAEYDYSINRKAAREIKEIKKMLQRYMEKNRRK